MEMEMEMAMEIEMEMKMEMEILVYAGRIVNFVRKNEHWFSYIKKTRTGGVWTGQTENFMENSLSQQPAAKKKLATNHCLSR